MIVGGLVRHPRPKYRLAPWYSLEFSTKAAGLFCGQLSGVSSAFTVAGAQSLDPAEFLIGYRNKTVEELVDMAEHLSALTEGLKEVRKGE